MCSPGFSSHATVGGGEDLCVGVGNAVPLAESLPRKHKALVSFPSTTKARHGGSASNPSTGELEPRQEGQELQGHL